MDTRTPLQSPTPNKHDLLASLSHLVALDVPLLECKTGSRTAGGWEGDENKPNTATNHIDACNMTRMALPEKLNHA